MCVLFSTVFQNIKMSSSPKLKFIEQCNKSQGGWVPCSVCILFFLYLPSEHRYLDSQWHIIQRYKRNRGDAPQRRTKKVEKKCIRIPTEADFFLSLKILYTNKIEPESCPMKPISQVKRHFTFCAPWFTVAWPSSTVPLLRRYTLSAFRLNRNIIFPCDALIARSPLVENGS